MALLNTYVCDLCKAMKKETNHWWVGLLLGEKEIILGPFDGEVEGRHGSVHLCGIECATKWLSQRMQLTKN